jgi:hypothetical protein
VHWAPVFVVVLILPETTVLSEVGHRVLVTKTVVVLVEPCPPLAVSMGIV